MNNYLMEFNEIIESENREKSLVFIIELLEERKLSVMDVYEKVLTPSLNSMEGTGNEEMDIWKEHIRTSIVRTIIENMYPYVIRERDEKYGVKSGKKVAVICPSDEYHELGARMITDYFTMLGYEATYVGSNTPREVFVSGLKTQNLDYIAISISNPYHLISTRNTIARIREVDNNVKIIVGGHAIKSLGDKAQILKADYILTTFDDLISLAGGHTDETTL